MMKNRNIFYYAAWLLPVLMLVVGCNSEEPAPQVPNDYRQSIWNVTIDASSAKGGSTRTLVLGDDQKLYTFWNKDDQVKVLSDTTEAGTLTASIPDDDDKTLAKLTGTLTGTYTVGDILTLWYPDYEMTYDGQTGTLDGMSSSNTFLTAQSEVTEVDAANGVLHTSDASFSHLQAFLNLTFTDAEGNPLRITKLEIWTDGGKLVKSKTLSATSYADAATPLTVSPTEAKSQFFLSLRDEQADATKYHFHATTTTGASYAGTANSNPVAGHYYKGTLKLSPFAVGREEYGNGNGWDDLGTVETTRDGYGLGYNWDASTSVDTERGDYGNIMNWDGSVSGSADRDGYGSSTNWDKGGSGSVGRGSYGSGNNI